MKRGFINFKQINNKPKLDDLWFMLGSRCNLTCSHCYVASSPTNDTLEQMNPEDIKPFLEEATTVENIYFTGGEPFINKHIIEMITLSLIHANVTVLTNATHPISRHIPTLAKINQQSKYRLKFRISLDHYDKDKHEEIRGKGSFEPTIKNTLSLANAGFTPIITSTAVVHENNNLSNSEIEIKYKELFPNNQVEVKLLPFNLEMGSNLNRITPTKSVTITEDCMNKPNINQSNFQCHNGRTIQKIENQMRVYPCPIIYNDPKFELASSLKESYRKIYLTHKSCFDFCYKSGGTCTN